MKLDKILKTKIYPSKIRFFPLYVLQDLPQHGNKLKVGSWKRVLRKIRFLYLTLSTIIRRIWH